MIISYGATAQNNPGGTAITDVITRLNNAIGQRMAVSNSLSNVATTALFGRQHELQPLNDQPSSLSFKVFSFYFKDHKDPAGLMPLQGLTGVTYSGASLPLGTEKPDQVFNLDFSTFGQISEITTFYAQATDDKQKSRYGHRIVALYFTGKSTSGGPDNRLVIPASMGVLGNSTTITTVDALRAAITTFNGNNTYQILEDTRPVNLTFALPTQSGQRLTVLNAAASFFKGASCQYIHGLSLVTALPTATVSFDATQVTSVKFALDFEAVNWGANPPSDTGSYEISFQATRSRRNLEITQSGSTHSLTIPISSAKYGFTYTESESRQVERSAQNQVAEKLTVKLPAKYYRLTDFTGTAVSDVSATIQVVSGTDTNYITVPLGKKVLLCAEDNDVANAVIAAI